jgi:hypothetical protein
MTLPELKDLFDYEYKGGGYFRKKGARVNTPAPTLHGEEAVKHLYDQVVKHLQNAGETDKPSVMAH